jgi:hypothetical protein
MPLAQPHPKQHELLRSVPARESISIEIRSGKSVVRQLLAGVTVAWHLSPWDWIPSVPATSFASMLARRRRYLTGTTRSEVRLRLRELQPAN